MNDEPKTHAAWQAMLAALPAGHLREIDQHDRTWREERAAKIERHKKEQAGQQAHFEAWQAEREEELAAERDKTVTPALAAFGRSDPLKQAAAIGDAVRGWNARARELLGANVHPIFLVDALASGNAAIGDPQFVSCAVAGHSCDLASRVLARILDNCGPRELMRDLIDLGVIVERDMAAISPSRIGEQTKARAAASRERVSFRGVLRALEAVDAEFEADRDAQAHADPAVRTNARIV